MPDTFVTWLSDPCTISGNNLKRALLSLFMLLVQKHNCIILFFELHFNFITIRKIYADFVLVCLVFTFFLSLVCNIFTHLCYTGKFLCSICLHQRLLQFFLSSSLIASIISTLFCTKFL